LETKNLGFDHIKELYQNDDDFFLTYKNVRRAFVEDFSYMMDFFFKIKTYAYPRNLCENFSSKRLVREV